MLDDIKRYDDLELSILSILLQKPELMEKVILEDKHFIKHKQLWLYMKAFYNRFHNFDFSNMCGLNNKGYETINNIVLINSKEGRIPEFENYQKLLIELYEETKKEKWLRENIYELACNLIFKNIDSKEFKIKLDEIYNNADEIFKEDKNE